MILYYSIPYYINKIMHELSDKELYKAIEYARDIDEATGRSIMETFQAENQLYLKPSLIYSLP